MPPDLALLSTLTGSNYPCLELIFMVPKVFEPLKFDCILYLFSYKTMFFCSKIQCNPKFLMHVYNFGIVLKKKNFIFINQFYTFGVMLGGIAGFKLVT